MRIIIPQSDMSPFLLLFYLIPYYATYEVLLASWNLTKIEFEHIFVISTSNHNFHLNSDNFDLKECTLVHTVNYDESIFVIWDYYETKLHYL